MPILAASARRRGATRPMSTANRAAYREKLRAGAAHAGQPRRLPRAGGRILPLARCRQWRGGGAQAVARGRASGCCPAPIWDEKSNRENPSQTLDFPTSAWRSLAICQPLWPHSKGWGKSLIGVHRLGRMAPRRECMNRGRRRIMAGGVYQPRRAGRRMADALADARRGAGAADARSLTLRGAGLLLFWAALAALLALASYNPADPSLNNATGAAPSNLLAAVGRHRRRPPAADLRHRGAVRRWRRRSCGASRALTGRTPEPRACGARLAWPLGTVTVAAGLGVVPAAREPARGRRRADRHRGAGLSAHVATGLWPALARLGAAADAAGGRTAAGLPRHRIALPAASLRGLGQCSGRLRCGPVRSCADPASSPSASRTTMTKTTIGAGDDEDMSDDGYALKPSRPSRSRATSLAERRESRVKREAARKAAPPKARAPAGAESRRRANISCPRWAC